MQKHNNINIGKTDSYLINNNKMVKRLVKRMQKHRKKIEK